MEPHRASALLGDLQELGRRTARQLSQDPALHSLHQNSNRLVGQRSPRPSPLSNWHGTHTRTTSGTSHQASRNPAQVELHYLTQSVKLFLRQPLVPPILMPLFLLLGSRNRICAQVAQWLFPSPTTHKRFPQIIPLFEFPSYRSRIHQRLVRPGNDIAPLQLLMNWEGAKGSRDLLLACKRLDCSRSTATYPLYQRPSVRSPQPVTAL